MKYLNSILKKLEISEENELFHKFSDGSWKEYIPLRLKKGLYEIKPDSLLIQDNKVIALFFTELDSSLLKETFLKIWNLGITPIIFIINDSVLDIYNGFSFDIRNKKFNLLKIGNKTITKDNLSEEFSIWDIFSGKKFENLKKEKVHIDLQLLRNLESIRTLLIKNKLKDVYAQNIIGRLLFSRYLLDKDVKINQKYFHDKKSFLKLIQNKDLLYDYFNYLKYTFNGDLFPVTIDEQNAINDNHLTLLYHLFSGSKINDNYIEKSLFDIYDFNIIPIELISEVYERFMSKTKRKKQGAYYTPTFLVDYILEKTVKKHLIENNTCKVFDPSCGSGIFLVESLRAIIENSLNEDNKIEEKKLKKLLIENIFGVDLDENAINLTIFSLSLVLLDYIEPKDITKFKFPSLKNNNLFVADFFNLEHEFNHKIKNLDFILGNPPWKSDTEKDNFHIKYYKNHNLPISDKQIAQTFLIRTRDFSEKNTKSSFVLPSKSFLYNHKAQSFRKFWLNNFIVSEILELSPVRHHIFSNAIAPTFIAFFNYNNNSKKNNHNIISHISIKPNIFLNNLSLIVVEKNDIKKINQSYFIKYDWLWKIMLYGNILDFYLIKRLKENYKTIKIIIEENNLTFGQGFIKGKNGKYSPKHLLNKTYLDAQKKGLSKFFINEELLSSYQSSDLIYRKGKYDGKIFKPPYILIKQGFSKKDFSIVSSYTEKEFVFTASITAIQGNDKNILKSISGVTNSILYSYFVIMQTSYGGIEREKTLDIEKFDFPTLIDKKISINVEKIQSLYKKYHSDSTKLKEINKCENNLNKIILESFNFSKIENELINYTKEITIPLINKSKTPIAKTTKKQLENYAKIFFEHFSLRWNKFPNFFEIDIFYNDYIVGMNFKVTNKKSKVNISFNKNKKVGELLTLMKLGEEKITDTFYKQRDIRGFNETSFYIVKPNEYKNWHPAIAYGDLSEFIEAMLHSERRQSMDKI